ncbi:hypothetical protein HZF08_10805 [Paenibacillus sp. CGMCC 1.16610]|uniref:Uncharacterized protein n=1 Tax=Paenibacillus anseongense TaxID=2682845 RepID=A0ABW9U407_9BACL|nr:MULTISPECIES: hypothetical protein [Paenibacillus]MBA2938796.1 hypothetical protein [Paenibacillus sp. CGMCC 1.16610]MVQ34758.1 hypothetical protein [Paenibacillus anseongense]
MKLLKTISMSLLLASSLVLPVSAFANESVTPNSNLKSQIKGVNVGVTEAKKYSAEEAEAILNNSVPATIVTPSNINTFSIISHITYAFQKLNEREYVDTLSSFTTTGSSTNVNITLVQWSNGSTKITYQLFNSSGTAFGSPQLVTGDYTSSNLTIGISNVPAGTYRIRISNVGSNLIDVNTAAGNGYTQ